MAKAVFEVELAACLAVVEEGLAMAAKTGVVIPAEGIAGLELVRSMTAGAVADASTIEAARAAVEEVDIATRRRRRELVDDPAEFDRLWRATWGLSSIHNLLVLATRRTGWAKLSDGIVESAAYANVGEPVAALAKVLERARTSVTPVRLPTPKRPPKPALAGGRVAALGPVAAAFLRRRKAVFEPVPASELVLDAPAAAFEAAWGGLRFRDDPGDDDPDMRWLVGPHACAGDDPPKPGLVAVILSPNDLAWYLAPDGTGWAQDLIEDPEPTQVAADPAAMLVRALAWQAVFERRGKDLVVDDVDPASLGLEPIAAGTDALGGLWGDDDLFVVREGETTAAAARTKALKRRL